MKLESSKAKNSENIEIFLNSNDFFYVMEQIDPPNLGFWTLTFTFFQIRLVMFQKN